MHCFPPVYTRDIRVVRRFRIRTQDRRWLFSIVSTGLTRIHVDKLKLNSQDKAKRPAIKPVKNASFAEVRQTVQTIIASPSLFLALVHTRLVACGYVDVDESEIWQPARVCYTIYDMT